MISSSPNQTVVVDLPDGLFDERDSDDGIKAAAPTAGSLFPDEEPPSTEFMSLVKTGRQKRERRKAKPKTMAAAVFERALTDVDEMIRSGDWEGAGARHLVALYDRMHLRCYNVESLDLGPAERFNAMMLASAMLKREFSDDLVKMVNFMLWVWQREIERENWRRENGREGGRIGVRLMFSNSMLTDYRVHLARRGRRA